jgi:alkaline phosphatase D
MRLQPEGFYPLYDFTSSPLTAGAATPRGEFDNPARVEGTLVYGQRNFGTLTVEGPRTDRTLTMRTYDVDGELLWEYAIPASELKLPREE